MENQAPLEVQTSLQQQASKKPFLSSKKYWWAIGGIILVLLVSGLFLISSKRDHSISPNPALKLSPTPDPTVNWKTYINTIKTLSVQYPSNWIVKESHTLSNRVLDNPKEINTTTITGNEGKIVIEWGPMGFGGGCDPKDHKMFHVKNKTMDICTGVNSDGTEYWGGISNGAKDDRITEIRATAYKPNTINAQTVQAILATITFLDTSMTPTCRPRPACLDATPRCMIPETDDMCPKVTSTPTPPPGCYYAPCIFACRSDTPDCCKNYKTTLMCPTVTPQVACSQEARLCPDGKTYVSRQGPKCEFTPCPKQ